jgi:hypothetical protein
MQRKTFESLGAAVTHAVAGDTIVLAPGHHWQEVLNATPDATGDGQR